MKFKSHFCIIVDIHYSNNCHMALRTSSVPQVPTDSLRSLEFSSFSKISFHSKEYQSSDGARPKISGKVSGTVVDDDEGECNNTATEGESTNKDLSTQNAISNFFHEDTPTANQKRASQELGLVDYHVAPVVLPCKAEYTFNRTRHG